LKNISRRKFTAYACFFAALFVGGIFAAPRLYAKKTPLRPPGALEEREFLATCIKCGQCVQVCPYHSLSMFDITQLNSIGTPYIDARKRGCYLCDLFPCVLACPTGSLRHDIASAADVSMGVAFVKDIQSCLAYKKQRVASEDLAQILKHSNKNDREAQTLERVGGYIGEECSICADMCPYPQREQAIVMFESSDGAVLPKIENKCVGCGVCAELCPSGVISVIPRKNYEEIYG